MIEGWDYAERENSLARLKKNLSPTAWVIATLLISVIIVLATTQMNLLLTLGIALVVGG
jgi:hypothetical protein